MGRDLELCHLSQQQVDSASPPGWTSPTGQQGAAEVVPHTLRPRPREGHHVGSWRWLWESDLLSLGQSTPTNEQAHRPNRRAARGTTGW